MFVAQITIAKHLEVDEYDVSMAINLLLSALRNNGQVCGSEFLVSVTTSAYTATVLIPEASALDPEYRLGRGLIHWFVPQ